LLINLSINNWKDKNKSKIDPNVEIDIHTKLARKKGNRFVKIWESFVENGFVYLVMEYCEEGSLRDYVKKNGPMEVLLGIPPIDSGKLIN
jgi:serine/threonine protein kinase